MERQKVNGLHCSGSVGLQKKRKMVHVVEYVNLVITSAVIC